MVKVTGTSEQEPGERSYATVAFMTQMFGLDVQTLRDAMEEIELQPDFVLNGIAYYSMREGVQDLRCHLMNTGLLRVTMHIPAVKVTIKP